MQNLQSTTILHLAQKALPVNSFLSTALLHGTNMDQDDVEQDGGDEGHNKIFKSCRVTPALGEERLHRHRQGSDGNNGSISSYNVPMTDY